MGKETFQLTDTRGNRLHGCFWTTPADPEAVVVIIHGLSDHMGRYEDFSKFLNKKDIATIGLDQQGHGKSTGKRGHVVHYDLLLSNVENLMIQARLRYNNVPIFLYGQSLGGNIVANYTLRHKSKEIKGIILSSPMFELAFSPPSWKLMLAKVLGGIWPSYTTSDELDPMELSHDPWIGKAYLEDPLVHNKISVRLYNMMIRQGKWALEHANLLKYPAFILHGDEDEITSCRASEKFAEQAGPLAQVKVWAGLRHELHNERNKEEILNSICTWIKNTVHEKHV